MKRFIIVDWEMLKYGLSPLEVLLYAFFKPYTDKGIGYETKYADLAKIFSVTEGQLKYAVKHLKEDGFLVVKRRQYDVVLTAVQKSKNEQSEKSKNEQSETPQKSKLTLSEIKNRQVSHITNNTQESYLPKSEFSADKDEPKKEKKTTTKKPTEKAQKKVTLQHRCRLYYEKVYQQTKGLDYYYAAKDANALKSILQKIQYLMTEDEKDDENKLYAAYTAFINAIFYGSHVDEWIKDNSSLTIINSKFNEIYNQIKNGHGKQGTNRSGKGNARISADYVQKVMREAGLAL